MQFLVRAALLFACLLPAAHAQLFRAYLSIDGNDANPCTLPAPCRLLPAALAAVASGGEIWILDSANYNTATVHVAKSVTILAVPGAVGSVVAIAGPAISVTAPSLRIALRNLVVVPFPGGGGTSGLYVSAIGSAVTIEGSLFANLPTDAVQVYGGSRVNVHDSTIRGSGGYGIVANNGATTKVASSKLVENAFGGIYASTVNAVTTTVLVADSLISNVPANTDGIFALAASDAGAKTLVYVTRSTIQGCSWGLDIFASSGVATITVDSSTVTGNQMGYLIGVGGVIRSLGNNNFRGNDGNSGSLTFEGTE